MWPTSNEEATTELRNCRQDLPLILVVGLVVVDVCIGDQIGDHNAKPRMKNDSDNFASAKQVCNGSLADIETLPTDVCFSPKSGHWLRGYNGNLCPSRRARRMLGLRWRPNRIYT